MKNSFLHRTLKPATILVLFAAIFVYIFFSFAKVPSDSDFASLTLEADEMLHGNFFLEGWNLTGAAFTFTELPFYMIGVLVFGVDPKAFILANSLMVTLIIFFGYLLLPAKRSRLLDFVYLSLTVFPNHFLLHSMRAHAGVFALSMIGFFLIKRMLDAHSEGRAESKSTLAAYAGILVLGASSDIFILPILALPVMLVSLRIIVANDSLKKRFFWRLVFYTVIGILAGKLTELGYLSIGGANLNDRTGLVTFNAPPMIQTSINVFWEGFFRMTGAYATDTRIFSFAGMVSLLRLFLTVFMIIVMAKDVILAFKHPRTDPLSSMLALGMVGLVLLLMLAPFLYILEASRYFSYFPFGLTVLLCRWIHRNHILENRFMNEKISVELPVLIAAAFLLIVSFRPFTLTRVPIAQDRLATFLLENNLTNGYADFWQANQTTVCANKKLRIAALTFNEIDGEAGAHPYYWFSKDEWYEDPRSNFVAVAEDPYHDMTVDNVIRYLGIPNDVKKIEGYTILIYDPGLYNMLTKKKP